MTNNRQTTLLLVVAAALIDEGGKILLQRRAPGKHHAGLWEFPGGKIEPGESPEGALSRELAEELGITVDGRTLDPITFASEPAGDHHLLLMLYRCQTWRGEPRPLDADSLIWKLPEEFGDLPMPPGDRALALRLAQGW